MSLQQAILKTQQKLLALRDEVNSDGLGPIEFHQQEVNKQSMSFTGGDGRIYIRTVDAGRGEESYDISLSGQSIQRNMSPYMENLCGRARDGYKQSSEKNPYWRVKDFDLVKKAVYHYAKTKP